MTYEPLVLAGFFMTILGHFFVLAIKDQLLDQRMQLRALRVASWFGVLSFVYLMAGVFTWILR